MRTVVVLLLLIVPAFSGCADLLNDLTRPNIDVSLSKFETGENWNTDNRFRVKAGQGAFIEIVATEINTGKVVTDSDNGDVTISLPDGTWSITYWIDEHKWDTISPVKIDANGDPVHGLRAIGDAQNGRFTIGESATVPAGVTLSVWNLQTGAKISSSLPHQVGPLSDGLHAFLVQTVDAAGNYWNETVQVRVGDAKALPAGKYTFGIVARYTNEARIWDLTDLDDYDTVSQAQSATGGKWLGKGDAIDPTVDCVTDVVDRLVTSSMHTAERALVLFQWLYDNLEYDDTRLVTNTILDPCQVINDTEDANDQNGDADGHVADGDGNNVRGGICRDLAATYISLLRAAGVPARLVSGYLAGDVNGFHAWVEFYGGSVAGMDPWIPVDVSGIDGPYEQRSMLQSFGVLLPEYLALRKVPENAEVPGWSTALSMRYTWPDQGVEPKITLEKSIQDTVVSHGTLCLNPDTRARALVKSSGSCTAGVHTFHIQDFVTLTERVIDYGIWVQRAPSGTEVHAEVAYPFPKDVAPDKVWFEHYGPGWKYDRLAGKAISDFAP